MTASITLCKIARKWESANQGLSTERQKISALSKAWVDASSIVLDDDPSDDEAISKIISCAYSYRPRGRTAWESIIDDLREKYNIIYADATVTPPEVVSVTMKTDTDSEKNMSIYRE